MAPRDHRQADINVTAVSDSVALAKAAAERVMARIAANSGRVAICLTGGSSPKQLYHLLATDAYRSRIPWERVHWFIGDERFVPADDPLHNMAVARRIFLDRWASVPTAIPHRCFRIIRPSRKSSAGWSASPKHMSSHSCRG